MGAIKHPQVVAIFMGFTALLCKLVQSLEARRVSCWERTVVAAHAGHGCKVHTYTAKHNMYLFCKEEFAPHLTPSNSVDIYIYRLWKFKILLWKINDHHHF